MDNKILKHEIETLQKIINTYQDLSSENNLEDFVPRLKKRVKKLNESLENNCINNVLCFGSVPDELKSHRFISKPNMNAGQWQDFIQEELINLGYNTRREVKIEMPGRSGFIDLVAAKGDSEIAIELDDRSPRNKSIRKVSKYTAGMIILREPLLQ